MTRYLLDTNVFIRAKRDHYRFATFPCFWDWIVAKQAAGLVFSIEAVEKEIQVGKDDLTTWIAKLPTGAFLPADAKTATSAGALTTWTQHAARPYTAAAVATFFASADYWLVAHAHAHGFTVVTHEMPEPTAKRRVKIPDACNGLAVPWINPFEMLQCEGAAFP